MRRRITSKEPMRALAGLRFRPVGRTVQGPSREFACNGAGGFIVPGSPSVNPAPARNHPYAFQPLASPFPRGKAGATS